MKPLTIRILAAVSAGAAVLAAWGWWYASGALRVMENDYIRVMTNVRQSEARQTADARMRKLVADTADARARLEAFAAIDILSAAKAIESAGSEARVSFKVGGVSPGPLPSAAAPLQAITFAFEGEGSFPRLMRALQLLEALPFPVAIDQADMSRGSGEAKGGGDSWRVNGRIRMLTSASTTP